MNPKSVLLWASLVIASGGYLCEAQSCSQLQSQYGLAKAGLQRDVNAINSLGFGQTADNLEQWDKTVDMVKEHADDEFIKGLMSIGLQSALAGTKAWGSLTPFQAQKYIGDLKRFGIDSQPWFDSIRKVANISGKPAATKATKDLLEGTAHLMDAVDVLPKPQQDEARMDVLAGAVSFAGGFVAKSPEAGTALAGWSFVTSLAWSAAGRTIVASQINQFANLSDQQLKALASVDKVVHQHVAALNVAERGMASKGCISSAGNMPSDTKACQAASKLCEGKPGSSGDDTFKQRWDEWSKCDDQKGMCKFKCNSFDCVSKCDAAFKCGKPPVAK